MIHLIGIDVGASHIESAYATDDAVPIARALEQGTVVKPGSLPQAADAVSTSVDAVLPEGLSRHLVNSVVVGSAGVHSEAIRRDFEAALRERLPDTTLKVTTDGAIALESAFGDRAGIVICAGSGSIAYARDPNGVVSRVGGLGPILADEGSGYAIGLAGLRAAAAAVDGRAPATSLAAAIPSSLNIRDLDELIDWAWAANRPAVASIARIVLQEAQSGDEVATGLSQAAAEDLSRLAMALADEFAEAANYYIAFSGGILTADSPVRRELASLITTNLPRAMIVEKTVEPVLGALSLARRILRA